MPLGIDGTLDNDAAGGHQAVESRRPSVSINVEYVCGLSKVDKAQVTHICSSWQLQAGRDLSS
jgi:hypothetical protein